MRMLYILYNRRHDGDVRKLRPKKQQKKPPPLIQIRQFH